jgi:Membrane bound beta barrel domain (DUF5777)
MINEVLTETRRAYDGHPDTTPVGRRTSLVLSRPAFGRAVALTEPNSTQVSRFDAGKAPNERETFVRVMQLMLWMLLVLVMATPAGAQSSGPAPADEKEKNEKAATAQQDDPDVDINLAQPDFTLAAMPTTLRVPRHKSSFRVTHRFSRPLGQGDFGDLVEDLFGLDGGAQIGLEYRFGIFSKTQVGIHRTSDRTIEFFAQRELLSQSEGSFVTIDALGTIDGTNNFKDSYSPALGAVISREFSDRAAVYLQPIWVNNSNPDPEELVDDNNSFLIGLGTRVRIRPTVYLLLEAVPRVAGYDPGVDHISFGVEKRAGGHMFQLNFSNSFGTTIGQVARGGTSNDDWYLGFSISRKFF